MSTEASRRAFLQGRFNESAGPRPFGAIEERLFLDTCTQCDACAVACPEGIIIRGDGGYPVVTFDEASCTFCNACIEACDPGALRAGSPWTWRPAANAACLASRGIYCRTCQDYCDESAISFRLRPGGRSRPEIDLNMCTGCGACAAPCPASAIEFSQPKLSAEAAT